MTYKVSGFESYFLGVLNAKQTSLNSYNVNLRKVDHHVGGLDEFLETKGRDALLTLLWSDRLQFAPYDSNVRSAVRTYLRFLDHAGSAPLEEVRDDPSTEEIKATIFKYESELQTAIRLQLDALEPGLEEADEGSEMVLATGRPDIVARDKSGRLVAIELKAGPCPSGALEQVLGYAADLDDLNPHQKTRAILVAAEFGSRLKAAARRVNDLTLRTYRLGVQFGDA